MYAATESASSWRRRRRQFRRSRACIRPSTGCSRSASCWNCWRRQRTKLSTVIAELPPFHMAVGHVEGAWETKGRVMRCLIEQFAKLPHETVDGIKVYLADHEWVLIRPDNDTTLFHLAAEARSLPAAQELIADYGGLVRRYVQEPCAPLATIDENGDRWVLATRSVAATLAESATTKRYLDPCPSPSAPTAGAPSSATSLPSPTCAMWPRPSPRSCWRMPATDQRRSDRLTLRHWRLSVSTHASSPIAMPGR